MKRSIGTRLPLLSLAICSSIAIGHDGNRGSSDDWSRARNSIVIDLPNTTQGPPWPPSEVVDENGNFILIGNAIRETAPGVLGLVPNQAVIVSKETVPPLDENGVENTDNLFGAKHKIIRRLNLRRGSPDLDIVLHSVSFGPTVGNGNPRMPRIGESTYNLNGDPIPCPDSWPSTVQSTNYLRQSYPLHQVPVAGFQGDNVAYDITTGEPYDPMTASNLPSCIATGCPGEDAIDARRTKPITLGEWLQADGKLRITLTKPNRRGQFTAAKFNFEMRDMLANSIYSVWTIRVRQVPMPDVRERRPVDPLHNPNIFVTDGNGRASFEWEVANPFPEAATDTRGLRIIGLAVVYHSDQQNWGACFSRFGPGVDVHAVFNTLNTEPAVPGALPDMTNFVTVAR